VVTNGPSVSHTVPADGDTGVAINAAITAEFSEPMTSGSIKSATFSLWQGSNLVDATVEYVGTTAVLTPTKDLLKNIAYTVKITTGVTSAKGVALAADYSWAFTTGEEDTVSPRVSSTNPPVPDTSDPSKPDVYVESVVPVNNEITVTFSEEMDPASINNATFTLQQGTTSVPGTVTYDGVVTAAFNPASDLLPNTEYTATVKTGVTDLAGIPMAADFLWKFMTAAAQTSIPSVISMNPADTATNVPVNTAIAATFSEGIDPLTINDVNFALWSGTSQIPGVVMYDGINTVTFTPLDDLSAGQPYTVKITSGVTDLAGIPMASDVTWSFTTGSQDTVSPTVSSTSPADGDSNVSLQVTITATFSEAMDPTTISDGNFVLLQGTAVVPVTVSHVDLKQWTISPISDLMPNTKYTISFIGATDLAGAPMTGYQLSFTTRAQ
jgi:methionine-rich copper-binding protein CopC